MPTGSLSRKDHVQESDSRLVRSQQALLSPVSHRWNEFRGSRNGEVVLRDQRDSQLLIFRINFANSAHRVFIENRVNCFSWEKWWKSLFCRFRFGVSSVYKWISHCDTVIIWNDMTFDISISMFATMSVYISHIFSCLVIES